jgi:hypothetical protein
LHFSWIRGEIVSRWKSSSVPFLQATPCYIEIIS